ncbi:MAG: VOC family protein [Planctomycetes bacterium]|nr:VOC family protein [Planctomycetota bacterium]
MQKGGTVTFYVSDMDRAVEFYTNVLGLNLTFRAGDHWVGIDAGDGLKIGLHPKSDKGPETGRNGATIVGFAVTRSIDEEVRELTSRGAKFKGPIIDDANGMIRLAFLSDFDGNELYLCESKWSKPRS